MISLSSFIWTRSNVQTIYKKMAKTDFWILPPEDVGAASSFKKTLNGIFSKWVPKIKMSAFNFLDFHWAHSYGQDQMFRPFIKKWPRPIFEFCPLRTSGQPHSWRRGQKRRVSLTQKIYQNKFIAIAQTSHVSKSV